MTNSEQVENLTEQRDLRKATVRYRHPERQERIKVRESEAEDAFKNGMHTRGLIPLHNDGNCVFISLAQIVLGDATKFEFMRYMIMQRLNSFPKKY